MKIPEQLGQELQQVGITPTRMYADDEFYGIDTSTDPFRVQKGFLQQADNCYIQGAMNGFGGSITTRPGIRGELTTIHTSNPIYNLTPFIDNTGTTQLLYTSNSNLYKKAKGATSDSQVGSLSLNSPTTFSARSGSFQYYVDGTAALTRTDLSTWTATTALTQPGASGFLAGLDNDNITGLSAPGTLTWAQDYFDSAVVNLITDPFFSDTTTGTIGSHNWLLAGNPSIITKVGQGALWVDEPGPPPDNGLSKSLTPPTQHISTSAHAKLFYAAWNAFGGDTGDNPSYVGAHDVIMTAYDSGNAQIGQLTFNAPLVNSNSAVPYSYLFDFTTILSPAQDIDHVTIQFIVHNGVHFYGASVNNILVECPQQKLILATNGDGVSLVVKSGSTMFNKGQVYTAGEIFEYDFGSDQNWITSGYGRLFLPLTVDANVTNALQLRCYVRTAAGSNAYSNLLQIDPSGFAFVDLTTIDSTILAAVRHFGFQIVNNLSINDPAKNLFTIGALKSPGNLPISLPVYYVIVEVNSTNDATNILDVIQSDGSANSNSVTATEKTAVAVLNLPARTNSSCDLFKVFRFGGNFTDGYGRLICMERFDTAHSTYGSDTNKGTSPNYAAPANPYIQFSLGTGGTGSINGKLRDNTPDAFLLTAELYQPGRNAPPVGAQTICVWNNHVCLGVGSDLYLSWLVTNELNAGLYFTYANVDTSTDPSAAVKGFTTPVGTKDNDSITALVNYGQYLVIFKQWSKWIFYGNSPDDFVLQEIPFGKGLGCIAMRGAMEFEGGVWYVSANGLRVFDGSQDIAASSALNGVLNPSTMGKGGAMNATAYSTCALFAHAERLYLAAPTISTDTTNTCLYVFDNRFGDITSGAGWTRYTGLNMTGGAALTSTNDTNQLYLGGLDGQVYVMTYDGSAFGDKALPSSSIAPVAMTVVSRAYGRTNPMPRMYAKTLDDPSYFMRYWTFKNGNEVRVDTIAGETTALTTTVTGDITGAAYSNTYSLAVGEKFAWERLGAGAIGHNLTISCTATVTQPLTIRAMAVRAAETENQT